jgi:predicted dehydrogenase
MMRDISVARISFVQSFQSHCVLYTADSFTISPILMSHSLLSRRTFVRRALAGAIAFPWVATGLRAQSANGVVHHATFGCSGMAWADVTAIAKHGAVKVVAGCEVDEKRTAEFRKKFPEARIYKDFRELLEKEKDLQSVNVSTPDHMHAPIGVSALNRGLAVYGQKPLAHNLHECRRLTMIAREKKLVSQMGIQIHSNSEYRTACALIQKGAIGKVREVHTWSSKKWGDNGKMPTKTEQPPADLDWDKWLGVAAERPFIGGGWYHPGNWRKRIDFGTGTFGDMGCHIYDPVFKALALTAPLSVRSEGPQPNDHSWATDAVIHYVFPGTPFTEGKTVNVVWYDGDQRPPKAIQDLAKIVPGEKGKGLPDQGSIFLGTAGVMILPHHSQPRLIDAASAEYEKVAGDNHWLQFIETVLGKRKACDANFDYAGPMTEAVLLGSVATRFPKQTLEWDVAAMKFKNVSAADQYVGRKYRKGWEVAGI